MTSVIPTEPAAANPINLLHMKNTRYIYQLNHFLSIWLFLIEKKFNDNACC